MDDKLLRLYLHYLEGLLIDEGYTDEEIEYLREYHINIKNAIKLYKVLDYYTEDRYYFDSIIKPFRREKRIKQLLDEV